MFNFAKKKIIENRENDDLLYEFVLTEIENEIIVKSLWAKAIAMAEGNSNKIEPLYMQFRVQNIKDQFTKLNIAYADLKKEILFKKIKSIFYDIPSKAVIEDKVSTVLEAEQKPAKSIEKNIQKESFEDYADRRSKEITDALNQYKK